MNSLTWPTDLAEAQQAAFLTAVLPVVEQRGRLVFHYVRCPHRRADAVAEMVALAWLWFVRLAARGRDGTHFSTALAAFAARAVRSGRRLCGQERTRDVLSPLAQRTRAFTVSPFPEGASPLGNPFDEALHDNTRTPPDEQAAFRLDFPAWRGTRSERDRRVVDALMHGERTQDVSHTFGLSPSRISQLRRDFLEDWTRFTADPVDARPA